MIPNGEGWRYLAVKKLSALLIRITSKHKGDLNCLPWFRIKNKLDSHNKVCENKDFCYIVIASEDIKTLEVNQYYKSDKAPFIIMQILNL